MNKEALFRKNLENALAEAKAQGNCITKEQVQEQFQDMPLNDGQMTMVCEYLATNHITIGETPVAEELSEEDVSYLDMYLEELDALPVISAGEKEAISMSAMAGDTGAKVKLIEAFLPRVVEIAKLYAGQGVFLEDLIGEGNLALTAGVEMLGCLEKPSEVDGMLGKMLMDTMEDFITENMDAKKLSEKVLRQVSKVDEKSKDLAEQLQRKVTVEELSNEIGMSEEAIRKAVRISANKMEYLDDGKCDEVQ